MVYRARVTIVLGALSAYALRSRDFDTPDALRSFLIANRRRLWLWGESAFPFLYSIAKYLEYGGDQVAAIELFTAIRVSTAVLLGKTHLEWMLQIKGANQAEIRSSGGSFILRPTLDLLARRDARDEVATRWKEASKVARREVRPTEVIDLFS